MRFQLLHSEGGAARPGRKPCMVETARGFGSRQPALASKAAEQVSPERRVGRAEAREGAREMNDLDAIILSHARKEWQKVARIAAQTMQECDVAPTDDRLEAVVARVRDLVARGRLEAKGDVTRPRFSEVRLPADEGR